MDVSREAGQAFQMQRAARGLALGDFDNNGAASVSISNNGGAPLLLHNQVGAKNHWPGVKLVSGSNCNLDAIGATVTWTFNGKIRYFSI